MTDVVPRWIEERDLFVLIADGDPMILDRIRYLEVNEVSNEDHLVIERDGQIVAMAGIQYQPGDPSIVWIKFVSVDPEARRQGYASLLVHSLYDWAIERGLRLQPSSFTNDGELYLKSLFLKLDDEHPGTTCWSRGRPDAAPVPGRFQ